MGDHSDIDVSYGQLGAYVADHALAVDGPVGEIFLIGPRDTDDSTRWRTEISWPIFRISPSGEMCGDGVSCARPCVACDRGQARSLSDGA